MVINLKDFVKIRPFGGIVIFDNIMCDGKDMHVDDIRIGCYTHIHNDHIHGIDDLLSKPNTVVLTTSDTKNLLSAIKGKGFVSLKNLLIGLEYKKIKKIDDFDISFHRTNHILGSGQLLVRNKIGSVLYSSDFMLKGTQTDFDEIDVLVLDGNHGSPSITQNLVEPSIAKKQLKELLDQEITIRKRQVNIRAHVGTLQKLMSWCDDILDEPIPFFANTLDVDISDVYRKESPYREIFRENDPYFNEITQFEQSYVHFLRLNTAAQLCETQDPMVTSIHFSDIRFDYNHTNEYSRMAGINLKEHAEHEEILEYVKKIQPKLVIVDNGPARLNTPKNAIDLSKIIQKKLNIESIYLPIKRPGEKIV